VNYHSGFLDLNLFCFYSNWNLPSHIECWYIIYQ